MIFRLEKMIGMLICAVDGDIGRVKDIYFEDDTWVARYLIVQTGNWLQDRKVLVSPIAVKGIDWAQSKIRSDLTMGQIMACSDYDSDKPIYRQNEMSYFAYYGYPTYWDGELLWGATPFPSSVTMPGKNSRNSVGDIAPFDQHLRSVREINGYHVHAKDGSIGHLEDFLIDEENWAIRFLVVDTHNWLPGRRVTIPPKWISEMSWSNKRVEVDVTKNQVRSAPEYDLASIFSCELGEDFDRHYAKSGHWD